MNWYCEKCKKLHTEEEMCPRIKQQLKQHPELLSEAADFFTVTAANTLISTQALDGVAQAVNKVAGTNLSFEGTNQTLRDIQVFAKLNSDSFSKSGQFRNATAAKETFDSASDGLKQYVKGRLNGTGQEIDWLRTEQGGLDNLIYKYRLPDGNTVGYDGIKINRFTGKTVERITVKAAEGPSGLRTNVKDIVEALEKNTLNTNDTVVGIEGTKEALQKELEKQILQAQQNGNIDLATKLQEAQKNLKIKEINNIESVKKSTDRLTEKAKNGQANTTITSAEIGKHIAQGAVIAAAVAFTVSSITSYVRYKNGELTFKEATSEISEETIKGALVGGAMGAINLFLPTGIVGYAAGVAIGMYLNATCKNILDEIYGKGAYGAILNSSGYVYGMTVNLADYYKKIAGNARKTDSNILKSKSHEKSIEENFDIFNKIMGE